MSKHYESAAEVSIIQEEDQKEEHVPRMRTMQECVDYFASKDPESCIKYCTLRRWVFEGRVPFIQIGRTKLINLDLLMEIVSGRQTWAEPKRNLKILPKGGGKT